MNTDIDTGITALIRAFKWYQLTDTGECVAYEKLLKEFTAWAEKYLDRDKVGIWRTMSDGEYLRNFAMIFKHPDSAQASRGCPTSTRLSLRDDFINALEHFAKSEDRFQALEDVVSGDFKVRQIGNSIWSVIAMAMYPDLPTLNVRSKTFFKCLNIDLGTTEKEMATIAGQYFEHWADLDSDKLNKLDFVHISHMIWFSQCVPAGQRAMNQAFGVPLGDPTGLR